MEENVVSILSVLEGLFEEHDGKPGHDGVSASSTTGLATILRFALAFWERFAATTLGSTMTYTCSLNIGILPASMVVVSIDFDIFRMLRHWSMCLFFCTADRTLQLVECLLIRLIARFLPAAFWHGC